MNRVNPNECFISLSYTAIERLRGYFNAELDVEIIKKQLITTISEAEEVPGTSELHFILKSSYRFYDVVKTIGLICVLIKGSPTGNKKFTVYIRGVISEDRLQELLDSKKGLTNLKHDGGIEKIGRAALFVKSYEFHEPENLYEAKKKAEEFGIRIAELKLDVGSLPLDDNNRKRKSREIKFLELELAKIKRWTQSELDLITAADQGISNPQNPNEIIYRLCGVIASLMEGKEYPADIQNIMKLSERYIGMR